MLSTSYLNVVAAAIYSIALVPIVLHFTSISQLGLWTLVTQFTAYLSLVDAGVCSACVRRFVGPIARKEMPTLAGIFKTAFLVSLSQGALCCLFGLLAYPIGPLLVIGPENLVLFSSVLFTQFVLVGIFFISTLKKSTAQWISSVAARKTESGWQRLGCSLLLIGFLN